MLSSNWKAMLESKQITVGTKRKADALKETGTGAAAAASSSSAHRAADTQAAVVTPCLSLDCEFVGVGVEGKEDALARVSIVNFHEAVLYDRFVKPSEPVTDYRTAVSGIKPGSVHGKSAVSFAQAQREVAALIKDRIVVGHALHNDLTVLQLSHPKHLIRDTSRSRLLCPEGRPRSLKNLARELLSIEIQSGAHDSVQDARVTLQLYKRMRERWEKEIFDKQKRAAAGAKYAQPPAAAATSAAAAAAASSSAAPAAAAAASSSSASSSASSRPAAAGGSSFSAKRAHAAAALDAAKLEARRAAKVERNQRRKKMRTEQKAEKQFG